MQANSIVDWNTLVMDFRKISVVAKRLRTLGPYWKPLEVDGKRVDLSHLEPFEFQMVLVGSPITAMVRVIFNNHCFSEAFNAAIHAAPLPKTHVSGHETRGFDQDRYELSKSLRGHIEKLPGQRIAQTRTGTLVKVTLADGRDYGIFFTLKRLQATMCELFVITAYPLDAQKRPAVTGEMRFNLIVSKTLDGKKWKFPNGRY